MKRAVSIVVISASVILLAVLIYALVFAEPESSWRKNGFVICIFFITTTRFAFISLRHSKEIRL
jgi:hypothetical protein